jgi:hypothetical protein
MMPDDETPELLFYEVGASWWWLLCGPISAVAMFQVYRSGGLGNQLLVPACFLVLVSGFLAVQVKAARIHTSVELTAEKLRQGAETIDVDTILRIYPEAEPGEETPKWMSSRALGELTGVPRRRTGIGLKLAGGRSAQAWAKRHRELRAALIELVEPRTHEENENLPPGAAS